MKKHVRSKFIFINVIFILSFSSSFGQELTVKNFITVRGENGKIVKIVDSLGSPSYRAEHLISEYFVDSLTNKPFEGKAVIYYGKNTRDSVSIKQGFRDGYCKRISYNSEDEIYSSTHAYYDQEGQFLMKRNIANNIDNARIRINSDDYFDWFELDYKKKYIQLKKLRVYDRGSKKRKKSRIKSLQELNDYFISIEKYSPERITIMKNLQFFQSKNPTL